MKIRPHPAAVARGPHLTLRSETRDGIPIYELVPLQIVSHFSWPWAWLQPISKMGKPV